MAAVAERSVLGMFAAAPGHRFGFGDIHLRRGEAGAFVGAVAERLVLGLTATAPIIGAGLGGLNKRSFASNFWFTHRDGFKSLSRKLLPLSVWIWLEHGHRRGARRECSPIPCAEPPAPLAGAG